MEISRKDLFKMADAAAVTAAVGTLEQKAEAAANIRILRGYYEQKSFNISGSPRKSGNSDYLCNKFSKGVTKAGHKV